MLRLLRTLLPFIRVGLLTALILLLPEIRAQNLAFSGQASPVIVHDLVHAIKPIGDDRGLVNMHTLRNIPKWDQIKTDRKARYIETLIFIDTEVKRWFRNDKQQIRRGIASLLHGINLYLDQINTRLIVLDIMEIVGYNLTLEQLSTYRNEHLKHLPEHDLAVLIRYGYEGGIAYVNGICTQSAVGITGFLPDSPLEYAAIFFHELAHLFGLTHDTHTNCFCENTEEPCLKIDGFDECSIQTLVDRLPMHQCIQNPPEKLPKTVLPICGNHYLEPGEECDCGPERFCKSLVCNPMNCKRTITDLQMFLSVAVLIGSVIILIVCCCNWSQHDSRKKSTIGSHEKPLMNPTNWKIPKFSPLKSTQSDPEIPIWKTPPYSKNLKASVSVDDKCLESFDETKPAIKPKVYEHMNLKFVDGNPADDESVINDEVVRPIRRPINRGTNKAIVRRPPAIPYLLDIGTLELPPKETHADVEGAANDKNVQSRNTQLLINNQLNSVISERRTEKQSELFTRSLSEPDAWNKADECNVNDALLSSSNGAKYRSATIVVGINNTSDQNDLEQQSVLLHSHQ